MHTSATLTLSPSPVGRTALKTRYRQAGRDAVYLLALWPVLLLGLCVIAPLLAVGLGTMVIWVGVPVLVLALHLAGLVARAGRRAAAAVDGRATRPALYRPGAAEDSRLSRLLVTLGDPQRWLDVLWVGAGFVVSLGTWVVAVIWLLVMVAASVGPLVEVIVRRVSRIEGNYYLIQLLGLKPELLWLTLCDLLIAVVFFATAPYVLRALVRVNQALVRSLLDSRQEKARLEVSRAALRRAEADTRRQLERDIHDGPQQRLVRLGMDLARARRQSGPDSQTVSTILDEAIVQTKEALEELRSLSRGIAPPVLVDRGLEAALSETAARSSVPVHVHVNLPRLPEHVEQTAYFVASEALANVNKHSGARQAVLGAALEGAGLRLWVSDDGRGGAAVGKGHGLAGLVQRLEGVGGTLSVLSPEGGPTTIQAVIPCES